MNCRRQGCGHAREAHEQQVGPCHTKVLTGWSEAERRFTGQHDCDCKEYRGPVPVKPSPDNCPHEVQTDGDNPTQCVHCKKIVINR